MQAHGERLLAHRFKTPYAEIDLVFQDKSGRLNLIEVKSCDREIWSNEVISFRQRARLERARFFLESTRGVSVRVILAVVSLNASTDQNLSLGSIRYFDDFLAQRY
jgi:Holliday junction resolvase-like predicted endonuclease